MSMWDLMVLYDTNKKRLEDNEARNLVKQQHKDLRSFYDTQIKFKKDKRDASRQRKREELVAIRGHHDMLNKLENQFMKKKRHHLRNLSQTNQLAGINQR